jgi:alkanesulfonate monooxygenase SsuD/methylene tetrahydromethanopterin reductase-like flavin-dependent oxidoreductase (luciferase family)
MLEAWTVLAGLAATVPRVRLGALVSPTTHRHPAVLAKMATTVDQLSSGRAVLGLGAGWQVDEHWAYGLPLPSVAERLDRLEEACRVVRALLDNERSDLAGEHFMLRGAPLAPKPIGPLPLLVGGGGERRTLRIAAAHADEWNVWGTPEVVAEKTAALSRHCEELGHSASHIRRSANVLVHLGDGEPPDLGRPILALGRLASYAKAYEAVGVDEVVVADFNHPDPGEATEVITAIGEFAGVPRHS